MLFVEGGLAYASSANRTDSRFGRTLLPPVSHTPHLLKNDNATTIYITQRLATFRGVNKISSDYARATVI
jgi:hypothetical protein